MSGGLSLTNKTIENGSLMHVSQTHECKWGHTPKSRVFVGLTDT